MILFNHFINNTFKRWYNRFEAVCFTLIQIKYLTSNIEKIL